MTPLEWIAAGAVVGQALGQTTSLIKYRMRLSFMLRVYETKKDAGALAIAGDTTRPAIAAATARLSRHERGTATSSLDVDESDVEESSEAQTTPPRELAALVGEVVIPSQGRVSHPDDSVSVADRH